MEPIYMGCIIAGCLLAAEIWKMSGKKYNNRNKYNDLSHWNLHEYDSKLKPKCKVKIKNFFKLFY